MQGFRFDLEAPPESWERLGVVMPRGAEGSYDANVTGDPCVVWDENLQRYRMFYFAMSETDAGEACRSACAISRSASDVGPGDWTKLGPLTFTNPDVIDVRGHKPFVVLDPYCPHIPARIAGQYWMFQAVYAGHNKTIMLSTAASLDGPWTVRQDSVVDLGDVDDFDAYNCDSPTAYWFAGREQVLIFYKGYPRRPQPDQPGSPLGSSPAAAVMAPSDRVATKLGKIISPSPQPGHWTSGWLSTPQILKAATGGWFGLLNASPTPPVPVEEAPAMREPAPSHGGWMYTPEDWPVTGWRAFDQPIEWVDDVPRAAKEQGEGTNFWKHHVLVRPGGDLYLYYNSGPYGQEQLFGRRARVGG